MVCKKGVDKNFAKVCARVSFLMKLQAEACKFIEKETLALVVSCEFCEIYKKKYFVEHLCTTASCGLK